MRKMGLEPTQLESYKILSLARLPVPTLPHVPALAFLLSRAATLFYNFFLKFFLYAAAVIPVCFLNDWEK